VAAVCALVDGKPIGMAVSSFTSVSLEPALASISVALGSSTWSRLKGVAELGVSVLAQGHDTVCRSLASQVEDRFAEVKWLAAESGAVFVAGATLWMTAVVDAVVPAGDHHIVVLKIQSLEARPDIPPLVFHGSRFRELAS
jgi:flavin reductase (DIM6/NTAB) family NADH-FMN oxidoreductase RutF